MNKSWCSGNTNGAANAFGASTLLVAAVAVRMPPFWRRNPEVQFTPTGITADVTKFNLAFVGLEEESIGLVANILEECSYFLT